MFPEFEFAIRNIPGTIDDELFIYSRPQDSGDYLTFITFNNGEVILNKVKYNPAESQIKGTRMPTELMRKFVAGIAGLAKEVGIEVKSESVAKGMLDAQSKHLADLRTLLKLK